MRYDIPNLNFPHPLFREGIYAREDGTGIRRRDDKRLNPLTGIGFGTKFLVAGPANHTFRAYRFERNPMNKQIIRSIALTALATGLILNSAKAASTASSETAQVKKDS